MNYPLLLRGQAARWYEGQSPDLGREFVAEVEAALNRIGENPLQYQTIYREVRRAILHKFPYEVFYQVEQDNIVVFAIVHLHRDPPSWQDLQ